MTAGELQRLGAEAEQQVQFVEGMTDQVRLMGLTAETFGLPDCDPVLIQKLRRMDPALRATITKGATA